MAMEKIDIAEFMGHVNAGLVSVRTDADLMLWSYTRQTQTTRAWDTITVQARGLVTTLSGEVVGRSMPKFFNHSETDMLPEVLGNVDPVIS